MSSKVQNGKYEYFVSFLWEKNDVEAAKLALEYARAAGSKVKVSFDGLVIFLVYPNDNPHEIVERQKAAWGEYQQIERRKRNRRQTIHEESPGRRISDTSIPLELQPRHESSQ